MNRTDLELIRTIANGDKVAFESFYDRHSKTIFGLLVKMLGQGSDAEDVLQETFWQVWRTCGRYDETKATPLGWVVMMARSRAIDRMRKKTLMSGSENVIEPSAIQDPSLGLQTSESANEVQQALKELPEEQRSAIALAFFGGLTYEQVAVQQSIPVGTAKTRIRLGLKRLRTLFPERFEG